MKWWMWGVVVLAVVIITFFYNFSGHKKFISLCGTLFLGYLLYGSYNFGMLLAKNTSEFYVPTQNCLTLENSTNYIIPNFYQGKAILIPIDGSRKMIGSFIVKDFSELECETERKYIGQITK